ncbi:MAG: hypothetical protein ACXU82_01185 [Caulobacteraceae bacterium]
MLLATTNDQFHDLDLKDALERRLRPAVGFDRPSDVLKDPDLDYEQKRAILSSWASDASAVRDRPAMRWLLGAPAPVPLAEVLEALSRLDRHTGRSMAPAVEGRA